MCIRDSRLDRAYDDLDHTRARVRALSPLETLRRGYSVLQDPAGQVVTSVAEVSPGTLLSARVLDGRLDVEVRDTHPQPESENGDEESA